MTDPKFMTNDARVRNSKEVIAIIEDWLKSLPDVYEAAKLLEAAGIPNCKLYNMDDLLHDPQVAAGGWLQDVPVSKDVTSVKSRKVPVGLANFSEGTIRVERAPALGEHTIEIFKKYGMSEEEAIALENKWNSAGK
jgi:formyl-CoA transferase